MAKQGVDESSGLRRILRRNNFDVNKFVRNTTRSGAQNTEDTMDHLNRLADEASDEMKRAIYANYGIFIDAGKAATKMYSTMQTIRSKFTDKERVITSLLELTLFGDAIPEHDGTKADLSKGAGLVQENKRSKYAGATVNDLIDLVDGISSLGTDTHRRVLYDGDLRELSTETSTFICAAHVFLFTDCLVIAYQQRTSTTTTTGPHLCYRLQESYNLKDIIVANIVTRRRRYEAVNSFKIMHHPVARVFQAENAAGKETWLQLLEDAKRSVMRALELHSAPKPTTDEPAKETSQKAREVSLESTQKVKPLAATSPYAVPPSKVSSASLQATMNALASTLPQCSKLFDKIPETFGNVRENPFDRSPIDESKQSIGNDPSSWLRDAPDLLEVAISERNFARATDLVIEIHQQLDPILLQSVSAKQKTRSDEPLADDPGQETDWFDLSKRIQRNEKHLADALQQELIAAADRHVSPGLLTAAVQHLGLLGKGTLAAQLFLQYRSSLLNRTLTRGVQQEGNQLIYLKKLSFVFHRNLVESAVEWQKHVVAPLTKQYEASSKENAVPADVFSQLLKVRFCSWVLEEANKFSQQLRVLLVDSRSLSFYSMAQASERISRHAKKVTQLLGVDVQSALCGGLMKSWKRATQEQGRVLKEAVEHRAKQDSWDSLSSLSRSDQERIINELCEYGVVSQRSTKVSDVALNVCQLVRSLCFFIQSAHRLDCPDLDPDLVQCIGIVLQVELDHYRSALSDCVLIQKKPCILSSLDFFARRALSRIFKQLNEPQAPELVKLTNQFKQLLEEHKS